MARSRSTLSVSPTNSAAVSFPDRCVIRRCSSRSASSRYEKTIVFPPGRSQHTCTLADAACGILYIGVGGSTPERNAQGGIGSLGAETDRTQDM